MANKAKVPPPAPKVAAAPVALPPLPPVPQQVAVACAHCNLPRLTTQARPSLGSRLLCKGCYYPLMHAAGLSPRWVALQANIAAAAAAAAAVPQPKPQSKKRKA